MSTVNPIGVPFIELSEVDSSNNYAMRMVQADLAEHGATWFAWYQNSGKGQRGKSWKAEPGQNIMMSVVLETSALSIDNQFILNSSVALACYDFFNAHAIDNTSIKWPNDIYWKDRKAGGILIETILKGKEWKYAIVGIGININQTLFPANLPNPVSLKQITGKSFNVIELAKELCKMLNNRWNQLLKRPNEEILNEYNLHLYRLNIRANFKIHNATVSAVVKGVNLKGELVIDTGALTPVTYGSVEWLLP